MKAAPDEQPAARIVSLATAVPPHRFAQESAVKRWDTLLPNSSSLISGLTAGIRNSCGVNAQYSSNPIDWFSKPHGYADYNDRFIDSSVDLLADAGERCLGLAGVTAEAVDIVIFVSSWGLSACVDIRIIERLGLRNNVKRMPLLGLGCAGGVQALSRAADLARANAGSLVLMLVVELPTGFVRHNDASKNNLLSAALCGDGAAAMLISSDPGGTQIRGAREYIWPEAMNLMGLKVKDDGPRLVMPQSLPAFLTSDLFSIVQGFLAELGMTLSDMRRLAFHPGGKEILKLYMEVFNLDDAAIAEEWRTLSAYGNMSGATIFFVLESYLEKCRTGPVLLTALGPGLTLALTLLDVNQPEQ